MSRFDKIRAVMKRNYFLILFITIVVFSASIYLSVKFDFGSEMFTTKVDDWTQRPGGIYDELSSVPCRSKHTDSRLVNYEMENEQFMELFKRAFKRTCTTPVDLSTWTVIPDQDEIVKAMLSWLRRNVVQIHENYQIVNYKILKMHRSNVKSTQYIIEFEFIIYRLPAYHGKHMYSAVIYDESKQFSMLAARLLGETPADQLTYHPVRLYDPLEMQETAGLNDTKLTSFTLPSLSRDEVKRMVDRQQEKIALRM